MITALQQGFSKKTGKPYAMVTLEDLTGSVSMLCLNEIYDRSRELLVINRALLVIAEVLNGEDKPKLFPQEIMALEDAPRKYTRQVHIRLHTSHISHDKLKELCTLVSRHRGKCPLFLCFMRPTGEILFLETHERFFVQPSRQLEDEVNDFLGADSFYAKVDSSLPEKAKRQWEKRADSGSSDE